MKREGRPIFGKRRSWDIQRIRASRAARPRGARNVHKSLSRACARGLANRKACRSARQPEIFSEGLRRLVSEGIGVTTAKADSSLGQKSEEAPDPLSIEPGVLLHKL